jgi:hypothetical protein
MILAAFVTVFATAAFATDNTATKETHTKEVKEVHTKIDCTDKKNAKTPECVEAAAAKKKSH